MKDFSFDYENNQEPKEIIESVFLPIIKTKSNDYLYANLKEYNGNIRSYETVRLNSLSSIMGSNEEREFHDIQDELGELNKLYSTYELFIGSNAYSSYKYRVMFIRYGKAGYPATVVMAEAISREIKYPDVLDKSYIYRIKSMQAMKDLINEILATNSLHSIMQDAINASIVEKRRNEKQKTEEANAIVDNP